MSTPHTPALNEQADGIDAIAARIMAELRKDRDGGEERAISNDLADLLTDHDVARICGLSISAVRRWRVQGQGPVYIKIGSCVRYQPRSVAEWLAAQPQGGGRPLGRKVA